MVYWALVAAQLYILAVKATLFVLRNPHVLGGLDDLIALVIL